MNKIKFGFKIVCFYHLRHRHRSCFITVKILNNNVLLKILYFNNTFLMIGFFLFLYYEVELE